MFDVWDTEFMAKLPKLKMRLEQVTRDITEEANAIRFIHGPFEIKLDYRRDNRFTDMMFDWVYVARSKAEEEAIDHLECMISDGGLEFDPSHIWSPSISELTAAIGEHIQFDHKGGPHSNAKRSTYHDLTNQLWDYTRYHCYREILENSEPVAELKGLGAIYSFERRLDDPLLVVPDTKIGLMLKLKY